MISSMDLFSVLLPILSCKAGFTRVEHSPWASSDRLHRRDFSTIPPNGSHRPELWFWNYKGGYSIDANLDFYKSITIIISLLESVNTTVVPTDGKREFLFTEQIPPTLSTYEACARLSVCAWRTAVFRGSNENGFNCVGENTEDLRCLYTTKIISKMPVSCALLQDPIYLLWLNLRVDENIQTFIQGGFDTQGTFWNGTGGDYTFSGAMGFQLLNLPGYECSLGDPCGRLPDCREIGSHMLLNRGEAVLQSSWGALALSALVNINQQLYNQYIAIKGATISVTLNTFNIGDFFPKPDAHFGLLDALTGLGTIFAVVAGFIPVVGPYLGAAGAILPAVGSFVGHKIAESNDVKVAQKTFAPKVNEIYTLVTESLDNVTGQLFRGESVNGVNITDMMSGGTWADTRSLTKVTDIEKNLKVEILSRSINSLWKTPTSNKMWILFVDLHEAINSTFKCMNDENGPADLKYCADGGVYYAYNFIETGDLAGHLGYPWGAQKFPEIGLNASVSLAIIEVVGI